MLLFCGCSSESTDGSGPGGPEGGTGTSTVGQGLGGMGGASGSSGSGSAMGGLPEQAGGTLTGDALASGTTQPSGGQAPGGQLGFGAASGTAGATSGSTPGVSLESGGTSSSGGQTTSSGTGSSTPEGTGATAGSDGSPRTGGVPGSGGAPIAGAPAGTLETSGSPAGGSSSPGGHGGSGGASETGGANTGAAGGTPEGGDSGSGGDPETGGGSGMGGAGGGGGSAGGGSVFPEGVTVRIMIVGDSISAGPGCYKKYLLQNLEENGYSRFEFVGEYSDDCGGGVRHSAVSCTTSDNYTEPTFTVPNCFPGEAFPGLATLVATHAPDLLLIQLGVNDVWSGSAPIEPILANYGELVEQARAENPTIVVVVAQIHKIITDNCSNAASTTNAEQLVNAVPTWAQGVSTEQSPVFVADLWTESDPREADDCVHPNEAGAERMGENWFLALQDILPRD